MSIWSDIWSNIQLAADAFTQNYPATATQLPQTPEGQAIVNASGFWGALIGFITALTDPGLWVSLAWIALGLILLVIGFRMWLGKPLTPSFVPIPV